jgi:hypothetical protein
MIAVPMSEEPEPYGLPNPSAAAQITTLNTAAVM